MLKLDIGCGGRGSRQPGFIGIDLWPCPAGKTAGGDYFQMDFVNDKLPWEVDSVDEAIALHLIEHVTPHEGEVLVYTAATLLKPGGTLTVTCPDLRKLCAAYCAGDAAFLEMKHLRGGKDLWPGPTLADRLNWAIHQEGHKWAYDTVSLMALARKATDADVQIMDGKNKWWTRPDHECGIVITKAAPK